MNKAFLILILPLSLGLLSACSSGHGSSVDVQSANATPVDPASASLSQVDAKDMTQYFADSASSDVSNSAIQETLLNQLSPGISFPNFANKVGGISPIAPCITIHNIASGDVIFQFACNPVGSVEIKSSDAVALESAYFDRNIEETVKLQSKGIVSNYSYSTNSVTEIDQKMKRSLAQNSSPVVSGQGGSQLLSINASKKFDDKYIFSAEQGEIKGQATYQYTPDQVGSAALKGAVQIAGTFSLLRSNADADDFTVTSKDLHTAACGLDKGSIDFKDATSDYVLTFTACGQHTLSSN